jgi:hypothetical protein
MPPDPAACKISQWTKGTAMGYTFHITRAEHWLESESNPISLEDWLTLVRQDPEMFIITMGSFFSQSPSSTVDSIHPSTS